MAEREGVISGYRIVIDGTILPIRDEPEFFELSHIIAEDMLEQVQEPKVLIRVEVETMMEKLEQHLTDRLEEIILED